MEKKHLFSLRSLPIGKILLLFLLIYIALLAIQHKNVSVSYQKKFAKQSFYSDTAGTERVAYINDNTDALLYRLHMLDEAKDEIILSTFDFNADKSGQDMMASLLHAADRGVSVRIYNPINLLKPWNLQARMHDKYVIVDQKMYLLGGRNTTNLFLGDYSRSKNIDRELFVYETAENDSSSIRQLTDYFESVWALSDSKEYTCKKMTKKIQSCKAKLENRYTSLKEKYPDAYSTWDYEALTLQTNKVSLLSNPIKSENKEPWMWYSLHQLMMQGECQVLADLMTIRERKGSFKGLKLCFVGDGNNMANSLIVGGIKAGMAVRIACPAGYLPDATLMDWARKTGDFDCQPDVLGMAKGADVVYTDVWASMGQEGEAEERRAAFAGYQVNQAVMDVANAGAMVLHCLPAHRGEEITAEVVKRCGLVVKHESI